MSGRDGGTGEGAHRIVRNGDDALDTCAGCDWESWDSAPSFPEHATSDADPASTSASEVEGLRDVNVLAWVLMAAWELAEGKPVSPSYVATHADMARAILASDWLRDREAAAATRARAEADRLADAAAILVSILPDRSTAAEARLTSSLRAYRSATRRADSLDPAPRGDGEGA